MLQENTGSFSGLFCSWASKLVLHRCQWLDIDHIDSWFCLRLRLPSMSHRCLKANTTARMSTTNKHSNST